MQCSKETIFRLFYNASSSFQLVLLFSYFASICLAKLLYFLGGNIFFFLGNKQVACAQYSDEEDEDMCNYQSTLFSEEDEAAHHGRNEGIVVNDQFSGSDPEGSSGSEAATPYYSCPAGVESDEDDDVVKQYSSLHLHRNTNKSVLDTLHIDKYIGDCCEEVKKEKREKGRNVKEKESLNEIVPSKNKGKEEKSNKEEEGLGECTLSMSSLRSSSIRYYSDDDDDDDDDDGGGGDDRDGDDDDDHCHGHGHGHGHGHHLSSSSSTRSCPPTTTTWEESYAVFHKYDEEMLLLDRLSFQKLQETESLGWIETCPRSKSERATNSEIRNEKKLPWEYPNSPYHELEAAYVAQICLTWEALKWNYNYFLSTLIRPSSSSPPGESESDRGCPATTAQQFQQFQVLLQRYIENEAYENGRRPEIYARMRSLAPMLLQVPHYISDWDEHQKEKGEEGKHCSSSSSRISSESFVRIMEEGMRTFMSFLKTDKKDKHCRIITALFRKTQRASTDHTLLQLLKKVNKKKKSKLKEIKISSKKSSTRRWLREEEEMDRLMAHIDLKVVSRVLKMARVNDKQLHWCEEKMSRVKFCDGKLLRDQFRLCPLFYPLS